MPSRVSQNPDAKSKTVATSRSHRGVGEKPYIMAEEMARIKPIILILFGVKPILCAVVACEISICWTFFLSFVSKVNSQGG